MLTLCVSVLVMVAISDYTTAVAAARHTGTRLIAYTMTLLGGIAGAIVLGPGFGQRRQGVPAEAGGEDGPYPMAVLGGVVAGLVALRVVFPVAASVEAFFTLLLVLVAPVIAPLGDWIALAATLCGVVLLCVSVVRLLDREIRRSRATPAPPTAPSSGPGADGMAPVAPEPRRGAALVGVVLCLTIGIAVGVGFALRLALAAAEIFNMWIGYGTMPAVLIGAALLGAAGGGALGWRLDRYLRRHGPRRRVVPLGAWYGYTPIAWICGILAAKLFSALAFGLASFVLVPVGFLPPSLTSVPFLKGLYFLAALAWMLIIGRAVARAIDAVIVRERSLRLPVPPPGADSPS